MAVPKLWLLLSLLAVGWAIPLNAAAAAAAAASQSKVPVDPAVYDNLVYYATFTTAAAQPSCANPPHGTVLQSFININSTSTQAALYRSDDRREFVLAFPGSNGGTDDITDLRFIPTAYSIQGVNCTSCTVHNGFLAAWNSAVTTVHDAVQTAVTAHAGYQVTIAGHSLGGALGELAFGSLAPNSTLPIKQLFTYGAPRVGNRQYADYIDTLSKSTDAQAGTYYRVTHANDPVPKLYPNIFGWFVHSRTEYWEGNGSNGKPSVNTTFRCFGQEPSDCNNSQWFGGGFDVHVTYAGMAFNCSSS